MAKAEKIALLGVERNLDLMYFIKKGEVWAIPRRKPGEPRGDNAAFLVAAPHEPIEMDFSRYLYFLDNDGDIARQERRIPGALKKKKKKPKKKALKKKAPKKKKAKKKAKAKAKAKRKALKKKTLERPR